MATAITPAAGITHDAMLEFGPPGSSTKQGLMLSDIRKLVPQIYSPFAPQVRQGQVAVTDLSILTNWEIIRDWSGGFGAVLEKSGENSKFAISVGAPSLWTGHKGRLLPPPALTTVDVNRTDLQAFKEFKSAVYALSNTNPGKVYKLAANGLSMSDVTAGLGTGVPKQIFTDNNKLYVTIDNSTLVRSSSDGATWGNEAFNADFMALRDENTLMRVGGATLTPGGSYSTVTCGWGSTIATNLIWALGSAWIFKPEGVYIWSPGTPTLIDQIFDAQQFYSTTNGQFVSIYNDLVIFNIMNRLYYSDGGDTRELFLEELGGFTNIDSIVSMAYGILIGARVRSALLPTRAADQSGLYWFRGLDNPGLVPVYTTTATTKTHISSWVTPLYASPDMRIYLCQAGTGAAGCVYLDFSSRLDPKTFTTQTQATEYIDHTEHGGGFVTVPKWYYDIVLRVRNPLSTTFARADYSIDEGAFTQAVDETGSVVERVLSSNVVGFYFPQNSTGKKVVVRIYLRTTSSTQASEITAVVVRGLVKPILRRQFSFSVLAGETVVGRTEGVKDDGEQVWQNILTASAQGYPSKLYLPDGKAYLVEFKPPSPIEIYQSYRTPQGASSMELYRMVQMNLMEINTLTASNGNYPAWAIG